MTDEVAERPDVVLHFCRECQRVTYEPRDSLPKSVIEPLDGVSVASVLGDCLVRRRRNHANVGGVLIGIAGRAVTGPRRNLRPELLSAIPAAIPNVEGQDLARLLNHGAPDPTRVRFLLYEAAELIRFPL